MNIKHMPVIAATLCAPTASTALAEIPAPTVEASFDVVSRQISRGLPDNTDPTGTMAATIEWYGIALGVDGIFNLTDIAEEDGFDTMDNTQSDYSVAYGHAFDIGTTLELGADYVYEYDRGGNDESDHVQYIHFSAGLPDLFLSPAIGCEWMLDQFHGQYYTLELSHGFDLIAGAGEDADPVLALTLSFCQGLANDKYNEDDLGKDFWALRESTFMVSLDWAVCAYVTVSPYVAYSDTYSGTVRDAAKYYEDPEESNDVAQFYGGVTVTASF